MSLTFLMFYYLYDIPAEQIAQQEKEEAVKAPPFHLSIEWLNQNRFG
ncbi:hypothetical protein JI735_24630 [Paenibacillus sonchi]|uniref:Uncharacterized protein n=1 Tax=Paenibacillus sonchi TaxID=373687 RepID=A0A974P9S9_9BACL|nr:hypothetical protein [Paenibacillus sonchi]QQZ59761.1 hypothetical protein JI735_24630 [Paenibacillus sonchi]